MHEVVTSDFHTKLSSSLRRPSFAGRGLPERMRTTAFAFLGLTAAAALTLVAIFAQLSFPLLSPAPLPSDPSQGNAVAEAVPAEGERVSVADDQSRDLEQSQAGGTSAGSQVTPSGDGDRGAPAAADVPAPAGSPGGAAPGGSGDGGGQPGAAPTPTPTPAPAPKADPVPPSVPVATPPAVAPPSSSSAPGRSASGAAASNASARGIEASSKQPSSSPAPSASASSVESGPPSQAAPNGNAKGHGG